MAKKDDKTSKNAPLIGIDIGGTGIKGGIVDLKKGKLVGERFRVPTPQPATPESVAEVVAEVVKELSSRPDAPAPDSPVGVTFPGIIQHGVVHSAANVDKSWLNTDIDALLTKRLGRPVEVINDADAAGLAEARYGAGEGVSGTVLVITLGTGIGSASSSTASWSRTPNWVTWRLTASTPRARLLQWRGNATGSAGKNTACCSSATSPTWSSCSRPSCSS
ncbi:polyphosphate glucokinase [Arthrobacter sp. Hiyo6]|nr:polyphosphate glucokinase [Arthrobacter sp. Hiyo6]